MSSPKPGGPEAATGWHDRSEDAPPFWLHRVEDAALALLLTGLIVLASLQIVLRNFFDAGIAWAEPVLRLMVLWLGLLGAMAASRSDRHVSIDALSRVLPPRGRRLAHLLTSAFTAGVAGLLAFHSARFVLDEREFGTIAFAGLPAWIAELVLPFAFGVIALRHAMRLLEDLKAPRDEGGEA